MNRIELTPGRAALSKAGRDAGRLFVVLREDGAFCWIADGDLRKVQSPKKKKRMHLRPLPVFFPSIAEILMDGKLPSDAEIRGCLADRPPREE